MKNIKTLYSFDFDDTLFFSPRPDEGENIYEEKTGNVWPYNGWWSKAETLDTDLFYIPINPWVKARYDECLLEDNSMKIVATGRLEKVVNMRKNVENIINSYGLEFDEIHLNTGGDTFRFKCKLFDHLIEKTKCDTFIMYDDRYEHIVKFYEWARQKPCEVIVVDVKNKKYIHNK
jgi:hypothetical protein